MENEHIQQTLYIQNCCQEFENYVRMGIIHFDVRYNDFKIDKNCTQYDLEPYVVFEGRSIKCCPYCRKPFHFNTYLKKV